MRELYVDLSVENPLSNGTEAGYIGENNATTLVIHPGSKILNTGCSSFGVVFLCKGEIYRTEQFKPASEFRVKLGAHLTQDHYLSMQLEGYSENNDVLYKSPMVTKIHFSPSIEGNESEIDPEDYQIHAQIALNTQSRHTHSNSAVINRLNVKNGELVYNNSPVCKYPEIKTVILSAENGDIDVLMSQSGIPRIDLISYSDTDSLAIPAESEILSVELQIDSDEFPEWLDLRDMARYDPTSPYILNIYKSFIDPESLTTVFARVFFTLSYNNIANALSAFLLRKARITYIENKAS